MNAAGGSRPFALPVSFGMWQYRELLRSLVARNLKVKYQRSALGFLWTLVNPLVTALVLITVFGYILRVPIDDFWAFLLSGYFAWSFLQSNLNFATHILGQHGQLRRSVAFPDELLIVASVVSRLAEYAVEMILILCLLVAFHHHAVPASYVLVPILVLLLLLLSLGFMFALATLSVFYSDVQHAMPAVLLTLFYVSPVFYSVEIVPERLKPFILANPIAPLLTLYHVVLFDGQWPSLLLLGGVTLECAIIFLVGYAIFRRYKSVFAEIV